MKRLVLLLAMAGIILALAGCALPAHYLIWEGPLVVFGALMWLVGLALYFLPTIIAVARHKKNILGVVLVNILLGWTFIGWIVALVWALVLKD